MTAVLLIITGLGFAPVQFPSIAACEQAFRDIMRERAGEASHTCVVVRTHIIPRGK